MQVTSNCTLKVAKLAFEQFQYGLATGKWQGFLDMITEDFTFLFPLGKYQGLNRGKEKAREFFQYVNESFPEGLRITLDRITSNETTVVFEFRDEGVLYGKPYRALVAISFDVCNEKFVVIENISAVTATLMEIYNL